MMKQSQKNVNRWPHCCEIGKILNDSHCHTVRYLPNVYPFSVLSLYLIPATLCTNCTLVIVVSITYTLENFSMPKPTYSLTCWPLFSLVSSSQSTYLGTVIVTSYMVKNFFARSQNKFETERISDEGDDCCQIILCPGCGREKKTQISLIS